MLRINLLPPYIYDKQKKIKLMAFWAFLIAAALGVFLMWFVKLPTTTFTISRPSRPRLKRYRDMSRGCRKEHQSTKRRTAPEIEKRQVFIADAQKYNDLLACSPSR